MSDNLPPTKDEIIEKIAKLIQPYAEPIKDVTDRVKFYLETGREHTKRIRPMINTRYQQIEQRTHIAMQPFHQYRRLYPWEIITTTTSVIALCSLPMGASATLRNTLLGSLLTTALINPEILYDYKRQYLQKGFNAIDSTNKSTFRW